MRSEFLLLERVIKDREKVCITIQTRSKSFEIIVIPLGGVDLWIRSPDFKAFDLAVGIEKKKIRISWAKGDPRKIQTVLTLLSKWVKWRRELKQAESKKETQQESAPKPPLNTRDGVEERTPPTAGADHPQSEVDVASLRESDVQPSQEQADDAAAKPHPQPGSGPEEGMANLGTRAGGAGTSEEADQGSMPALAEGTVGLGGQETPLPEQSRVPADGAAQLEAAELRKIRRKVQRAARERVSRGQPSHNKMFGGIFANPTPPNAEMIKRATGLFRQLQALFYSEGEPGPRLALNKFSAKIATLRLPNIHDHKEEFGRPGIAVFADVSGSMSWIADEVAKLAIAVQLANPDVVKLAGAQSNGYPVWYWVSKKAIEVPFEEQKESLEWYLEQFRKHDIKIVIMFADCDGEDIYRQLAKHVQVVWIDVFAGSYGEPRVEEVQKNFLRIVRANTVDKVLSALQLAVRTLKRKEV